MLMLMLLMFFLLETHFRASSSHSILFPFPCPVLYIWNFFVSNIESQVLHGKKDGDLHLFFQHAVAEVKAETGDFSIMQLIHPPCLLPNHVHSFSSPTTFSSCNTPFSFPNFLVSEEENNQPIFVNHFQHILISNLISNFNLLFEFDLAYLWFGDVSKLDPIFVNIP